MVFQVGGHTLYITRENSVRGHCSQLVAIGLCCLLSNCIKEVDLEHNFVNAEVVLSSVMRPDHKVEAFVTYTEGLLKTQDVFPQATVLLYQEGNLLDSLVDAGDGWHRSVSYTPIPGHCYELRAKSMDWEVSGMDCMPFKKEFEVTEGSTIMTHDGTGDEYWNYKLSLTHDVNADEFFEVKWFYIDCQNDTCRTDYFFLSVNQDPIIVAEGILEHNPATLIFSDKLFPEQRHVIFIQFMNSGPVGVRKIIDLENLSRGGYFRVSSISENAYRFKKSLIQYNSNLNTHERLDDIKALYFGSEPTTLYSNVKGGKGIVMAVNDQYIRVER